MNPEIENKLSTKIVLLTGAGKGIGLEAAKVFAKMGAKIIVAEIDREKGLDVVNGINGSFPGSAFFYETDLSEETQVKLLCQDILSGHGCPHIIFNNATVAPVGCVEELDISVWDNSYAVNLKAPVMLASFFLPHMKRRDEGCFVFVSSSGAARFMGAYETFKTSQVEFSNTLAMELEGSNVYAYTIGPGLVKTETAKRSIEIVASKMGMRTEEFYEMNKSHILSAEDAGLGFALSVINASKYHGQEISSIQVLNDFNFYGNPEKTSVHQTFDTALLIRIITTFQLQYEGWKKMNIFERQWVLRDFKKCMGLPADRVLDHFIKMKNTLDSNAIPEIPKPLLEKLKTYWERQFSLLQGYEKNPEKRLANSQSITQWINDIQTFLSSIQENSNKIFPI